MLIINLLKEALDKFLGLTESKINKLPDYFFETLPSYIKDKLQVLSYES